MRLRLVLFILVALIGPLFVGDRTFAQSPDEPEDLELLAAAGLASVGRGGDVIRYTRFIFGRAQRVRIVEAAWPSIPDETIGQSTPRGLVVELTKDDGAWRVTERHEAEMYPDRFRQLIDHVAALSSTVRDQAGRGWIVACSHTDFHRLDLAVPAARLRIWRAAHCENDAPAVVAGALVEQAVAFSLEIAASAD